MKTTIKTNEEKKVMDIPNSEESVFWKEIGKLLPEIPVPNTLSVETPIGTALFTVKARGSFVKNGETKPSMYVVPEYNYIFLSPSKYEDAYLTCINPESNNYKFYWLKPSCGKINATYGRIGARPGEMFGQRDIREPYESYLYWIRYYEKISKGYTDQTNIYLHTKKIEKHSEKVSNASSELYTKLKQYSQNTVQQMLLNEEVTIGQFREAKKALHQMRKRKTVRGFNSQLMRLMSVAPRKARYISDFLAKTKEDFPEIINREEDIINSMEAVSIKTGSFDPLGIEVYYATKEQEEEVLSQLSDNLKQKVYQIYRVIPKNAQKNFDQYLKKNKIHKVKQLWHGSKNCNWISIIKNGLLLHPNAIITGKMFGNGIYFSPFSEKSWGYTSYFGTKWAKGNSNTAFMGLYATAYGDPLDVMTGHHYTEEDLKKQGKNCVHAHKGTLQMDEIVYYNESAMVLNYIVEFH